MNRAKPITRYRLRDGDQIPPRWATVVEIMGGPMFELGVADVRAGRGYPPGYDLWEDTNDRWNYECGPPMGTAGAAPRQSQGRWQGKPQRLYAYIRRIFCDERGCRVRRPLPKRGARTAAA